MKSIVVLFLCICSVHASDDRKIHMIPIHGIYHNQKPIIISSIDTCPITAETVGELLEHASISKPVFLYSVIEGRSKDKGFIYSADQLKYWWRKKYFENRSDDCMKDPLTQQSVDFLYPLYWDNSAKRMWSPLGDVINWFLFIQHEIHAEVAKIACTLQDDLVDRLNSVLEDQLSSEQSLQGALPYLQMVMKTVSQSSFNDAMYQKCLQALEMNDEVDAFFLSQIKNLVDEIVDYHELIHGYGYTACRKQSLYFSPQQCIEIDDLFVHARRLADDFIQTIMPDIDEVTVIDEGLMARIKDEIDEHRAAEAFLYTRFVQMLVVEKLISSSFIEEAYELLMLTSDDLEACLVFLHSPCIQLKQLYGRIILSYCQVLIEKSMTQKALYYCRALEALFSGDIKRRAAMLRKSVTRCCGIM